MPNLPILFLMFLSIGKLWLNSATAGCNSSHPLSRPARHVQGFSGCSSPSNWFRELLHWFVGKWGKPPIPIDSHHFCSFFQITYFRWTFLEHESPHFGPTHKAVAASQDLATPRPVANRKRSAAEKGWIADRSEMSVKAGFSLLEIWIRCCSLGRFRPNLLFQFLMFLLYVFFFVWFVSLRF